MKNVWSYNFGLELFIKNLASFYNEWDSTLIQEEYWKNAQFQQYFMSSFYVDFHVLKNPLTLAQKSCLFAAQKMLVKINTNKLGF